MYDRFLYKVRFLLTLATLALVLGCSKSNHSSVPVSISVKTPYKYDGRIGRIWGGDNFEVVCEGKIHYAFIRGIDTPEPGQPYYREAIEKLVKLCRKKKATINVIDRDEMKREVCDLTVTDPKTMVQTDPALELVKSGLAWHVENNEEWSRKYKLAEARAREERKGIWSQPNPVPPWEFWENQIGEFKHKTEGH